MTLQQLSNLWTARFALLWLAIAMCGLVLLLLAGLAYVALLAGTFHLTAGFWCLSEMRTRRFLNTFLRQIDESSWTWSPRPSI